VVELPTPLKWLLRIIAVGYVFFLVGYQDAVRKGYAKFASKRVYRLFTPFLLFGVLTVIGKFLAAAFVHVDKPPDSILTGILAIFTNPPDNPVLSIWFLWVLLVFSLLTPLLWRLMGPWLLALAPPLIVLAALFVVTDAFYLERIVRNAGFFLLGGAGFWLGDRWLTWLKRLAPLTVLLFAASLWIMPEYQQRFRLAVCGTLAILSLHGLFLWIPWGKEKLLVWLGENLFTIYLLNTICIGIVKAAFYKLHFPVMHFQLPFLAILLAAGMIGPILIREILFRPIKPLYDLTK